jgi:hypothetical protein
VNDALEVSSTLCQPAARMVCVYTWVDDDGECWHDTVPVVAVESVVYRRGRDRWTRQFPIVARQGGVGRAGEEINHDDEQSEVVVADWPPCEDAVQLRSYREYLEGRARAAARYHKAMKRQEAPKLQAVKCNKAGQRPRCAIAVLRRRPAGR